MSSGQDDGSKESPDTIVRTPLASLDSFTNIAGASTLPSTSSTMNTTAVPLSSSIEMQSFSNLKGSLDDQGSSDSNLLVLNTNTTLNSSNINNQINIANSSTLSTANDPDSESSQVSFSRSSSGKKQRAKRRSERLSKRASFNETMQIPRSMMNRSQYADEDASLSDDLSDATDAVGRRFNVTCAFRHRGFPLAQPRPTGRRCPATTGQH